ncbi:hypothetical protein HCTETULN_011 [Candidatus Hodgkinia cicadicola]|nr:hypothetical protein HCTETULN_011 [Candidatus Hodgkinia cicadicola]
MLKTGSAALVIGVHQRSNWVPSRLSVKAKNVSLITIPNNVYLPHVSQFNVVCSESQARRTVPEGAAVRSETKSITNRSNPNLERASDARYTMCLHRFNPRKGIIVRITNWLEQVNALFCLQSARQTTALFPRLLTPFL